MENLDWPNRRHLPVDIRTERLLHIPTGSDLDRDVGATAVFRRLAAQGKIEAYRCYAEHLRDGADSDLDELVAAVERFAPTIVLWQHPGSRRISRRDLRRVRAVESRPILGYDEKDPYLFVRKRLSAAGRALARSADRVFLTGAGAVYWRFRLGGARSISYSPSTVDPVRFGEPVSEPREPRYDAVMVANRVEPRWSWWPLDPIPGVRERVRLVERLVDALGERFAIYGKGWEHLPNALGPVPFDQQAAVLKDATIAIGWDHLDVPYNFSNRLPIALLSGVPFVTNEHDGYRRLFRNGEHLFMTRSVDDAVALVRTLLEEDRSRLREVGRRARSWAMQHFTTDVVYRRQLEELAVLRASRR